MDSCFPVTEKRDNIGVGGWIARSAGFRSCVTWRFASTGARLKRQQQKKRGGSATACTGTGNRSCGKNRDGCWQWSGRRPRHSPHELAALVRGDPEPRSGGAFQRTIPCGASRTRTSVTPVAGGTFAAPIALRSIGMLRYGLHVKPGRLFAWVD